MDLLDAAYRAGIALASSCGGEGLCGKCKVVIKKGEVKCEQSRVLNEKDRREGYVLACEALVESDLVVFVPPGSIEFVEKLPKDAGEIPEVELGEATKSNFGFAFDIGTTTITGQLIDLASHRVCGTRIAYNRQTVFGADVIARIIYAQAPEGLERLNEAVLANINEMAEELALSKGIRLGDIFSCVIAGNTTMTHLLFKVDPSHIRKVPYIPTITIVPFVNASEVGIKINPKGVIYCLSGVSAYIGGDVVAGVLSSGLFEDESLSILVDIGTNGEIVLGNREWMMACSASAGPAFEGSGVASGMKAVAGAIQKASIDDKYRVSFETIAGEKPKGICGSGYIDLIKCLLKTRIIGRDGRMDGSLKSKRIRKTDSGYEFIVAFASESATEKDITISEDDIENIKRSKAAIYSAIMALVCKVDVNLADVKRIYVAGGFGNYLDIESAIYIGLLPDIDRKIYKFIGNSSLAGARLSLVSEDALKKTDDIYKKITYLSLSSEIGYMDEYIAALFFPHTDLERFPSVR